MHPLVEASRDHFISKARRQGEALPLPSVKQRQTETKMGIRELIAGDYASYMSRLVFQNAHRDICFSIMLLLYIVVLFNQVR